VRYTAEYRGGAWGDKPWEWCVIDEDIGPIGCVIISDLMEDEAKAKELNEGDYK
jgi:hypothetical protein